MSRTPAYGRHWRDNSRIEDIDAGIIALADEIRVRRIKSIAIPPLGCGLAGLDWPNVRRHIEAALRTLDDVHVVLFEPHDASTAPRSRSRKTRSD